MTDDQNRGKESTVEQPDSNQQISVIGSTAVPESEGTVEEMQSSFPDQGYSFQDEVEFNRHQSQRDWISFKVHENNQQAAVDVQGFQRPLQRFNNRCPWCFVCGWIENTQHRFWDCSIY